MRYASFALVLSCALFSALPAYAQGTPASSGTAATLPAEFTEENGKTLVHIDGKPVQLETLIVKRKDAEGRLPIALITHGQALTDSERGNIKAVTLQRQARDMAWRGWLAVVVIRRGYGVSDGPIVRGPACKGNEFADYFRQNGKDLLAVLQEAGKRPDAKPDTVIAMGNSMGGASVLGLAALGAPGLKGIVNLSGGLRKEDCPDGGAVARAEAMAALAPQIKVPSLWIYAENDSFFSPTSVDLMYEQAVKGGMNVQRVALPPTDNDGHFISGSPQGRTAIMKALDPFLRNGGLPTWSPKTVDQILRAFNKTSAESSQQRILEQFAAAPTFTAMAYSSGAKRFYIRFGGRTPEATSESVLKDCTSAGNSDCLTVRR